MKTLDLLKHCVRRRTRPVTPDERLADALSAAVAQATFRLPPTNRLTELKNSFIRYDYLPTTREGGNLGDWIQSEATEQAIRQAIGPTARFTRWLRSELSHYSGEPALCVMQGWFEHSTLNFLPNDRVLPVWVGTHFTVTVRRRLEWLRRFSALAFSCHEIGCRDLSTLQWCKQHQIRAYFSRCLTLTLPRREKSPTLGTVFCVDCPPWVLERIPENIKRGSVEVVQRSTHYGYSIAELHNYEAAAMALLRRYRDEASLVITTALHCAQPCVAMGIPVVFINPDYRKEADRFSAMQGIIPFWSRKDLDSGRVDFIPTAPDIESLKADLIANLRLSIAKAKGEPVDALELDQIRTRIRDFNVVTR